MPLSRAPGSIINAKPADAMAEPVRPPVPVWNGSLPRNGFDVPGAPQARMTGSRRGAPPVATIDRDAQRPAQRLRLDPQPAPATTRFPGERNPNPGSASVQSIAGNARPVYLVDPTPGGVLGVTGSNGESTFQGAVNNGYAHAIGRMDYTNAAQGAGPNNAFFAGQPQQPRQLYSTTFGRNNNTRLGNNGTFAQAFGRPLQASQTSVTGFPNARLPHTIRVSKEFSQITPEDLAFRIAFIRMKAFKVAPATSNALWEANSGTLPIQDAAPLAATNMMLASIQTVPESPDKVFTVQQALEKFALKGVIKTDSGPSTWPTSSGSAVDEFAHSSRNLVVLRKGDVEVYNYWSAGKMAMGQDLYLLLKGIPVGNIRGAMNKPPLSYNVNSSDPEHVYELPTASHASVVLQFVPWLPSGVKGKPGYKDLKYYDDFGIEHVGVALRVGTLLEKLPGVGNGPSRNVAFSEAAAISSGPLRILVDTTPGY